MRIEQLEYLAAVIQFGSLRRASEQLHVSQPALSEAVSKLERELGVSLLDRRRSGARISRRGRELLGNMVEVLESVDRLRAAAGDPSAGSRVVRVGTVGTATSTLLVPAVRDLRTTHPDTTVDVVSTQQAQVHQGLLEGTLDLGLVNLMQGDDLPGELLGASLMRGRPVAVTPGDHALASRSEMSTEELRTESFIAMRAGDLMHRFAHRLFGSRMPPTCYTTDGAELAKVMVAEGLGIALLPDFSVVGDPMERAGIITYRPLADDHTSLTVVLCQARGHHQSRAAGDLHAALISRARTYRTLHSTPASSQMPSHIHWAESRLGTATTCSTGVGPGTTGRPAARQP